MAAFFTADQIAEFKASREEQVARMSAATSGNLPAPRDLLVFCDFFPKRTY
jgi:hypothetical protein